MESTEPSKPPKWRSRWPQYRLSTLLVVVAIVGVAQVTAAGYRRLQAALNPVLGPLPRETQ